MDDGRRHLRMNRDGPALSDPAPAMKGEDISEPEVAPGSRKAFPIEKFQLNCVTQPWDLSVAMVSCTPFLASAYQEIQVLAMRRDGQIFSEVVVGVLLLQASSKCRRPDDARTTRRYLQHIRASASPITT